MKDSFSTQATGSTKFRPHYSPEMYEFILRNVNNFESAWDCGTGNGQIAYQLSNYFKNIEATDISQKRLDNVFEVKNIHYQITKAEQTPFLDNQFNLITVGQALHSFDHSSFFDEVKRVAKPNAILASWGYFLFKIETKIDAIIHYFYYTIIKKYCSKGSQYLENEFQNIDFPFFKIIDKNYSYTTQLTFDELIAYLNTWSAVQRYIQKNGHNPIDLIEKDLKRAWIGKSKTVRFSIFFKMMDI